MKVVVTMFLVCAAGVLTAQSTPGKQKATKAIHSPKAGPDTVLGMPGATSTLQHSHSEPWIKAEFKFSEAERVMIGDYVRNSDPNGKVKPLPPGLAKKLARGGSLPPGWQKKCVVGEVMPMEVYARCSLLPPELVVKLPPAPEPTITVAIGGKVVRLLNATREILDVLDVHVKL